MKTNTIRESACFLEHHARTLFPTRIIDDQVHTLMPRQIADDFGIDPWDRIELARPVAAKMRPSQPCRFVRLPFRGHPVSLCSGEFGVDRVWRRHCEASPQMKSRRIRKREKGSFDF